MDLVTVVIPTYYRNDELVKAINSVVQQSYPEIEIIVVDDSGEGYARETCEMFDVEYVEKDQNEGPMAAWNDGFKRANGKYVQVLDDDDQLFPKKIEKQIKLLRNQKDVGVVHCGIRWDFGVDDFPDLEMSGEVLSQVLTLDTSPCVTSTMLIEKEIIQQFFPIDEYDGAADDVLKIELAQRTQFDFVDEVLVFRGTGDDNISTSMDPIHSSERILNEYSYLYTQVAEDVRRMALSKILYRKGYALLSNQVWSAEAIKCFVKSIYLSPTRSFRTYPVLVAAIFGRPGITLFERIGVRIRDRFSRVS